MTLSVKTLSRRFFMKGAAAAPLAVKAAQDFTTAQLAGVQANGLGGSSALVGASAPPSMVSGASSGIPWKARVLAFLGQDMFPDWFEEEMRIRGRNVHALDPDIASKRSWSLNVKIVTQRERNVQRAREDFRRSLKAEVRRGEFHDATGLYL